MIQTGMPSDRIAKCTKCRKEIGSNTSNVWLIGGWPFCSKKCVETNEVQVAWRRSINHLFVDRSRLK